MNSRLTKAILLMFLIANFFSCKKKDIAVYKDKIIQKDSLITFIFDKRDYTKDTLRFVGGSYSPTIDVITYSNVNDFKTIKLLPNNVTSSDTIKIKSTNDIYVEHKYHYYYTSLYNFSPGDTILFIYKDGVPFVKILNKPYLNRNDFNFLTDFNLNNDKPESREEFYLNNKRFRNKKELDNYTLNRTKLQLKLMRNFDSLETNNFISKKAVSFLKEYLQFSNPGLFIKEDYENELKKDSLLHISTFRYFLNSYSQYKFKISTLQKSKYESTLNYKALYDSISKNSEMFNEKNMDFLLFENLKNIANEFSLNDFDKYYDKFVDQIHNSNLIEEINKDYLMDLDFLKKETENVYLVNIKKEKFLLKDILDKNKGKVIYIDFWASWCAPCREAMADSHKLNEKYKDDELSFIYISIDKDYSKWEKASISEQLQFNSSSFLAVNYPSAKFYEQIKLNTLPRYMIYNKKGKLINTNTIAPNADRIAEILDKYLEE